MNIQRIGLMLTALLLLGLLAACGTSSTLPGGDPLNGTAWTLASTDGAAPLTGTAQTMAFADGKVSGSAGCNSYGGAYSLGGDGIQIKDLVSTLMACIDPQGVMEQEAAFLASLTNAATYEVEADRLQIRTSDGKTLDFVPAQ